MSVAALTRSPARTIVVPAAAAVAGGVMVGVASRGAASRPLLGAVVVALGVAAALAPPQWGLPAAAALSTLNGFLLDFVGGRALYWNEAFVGVLAVRSLVERRPTRREAIVAAAVAVVFAAYLASGTSPRAVGWGAKVLITSVVLAWILVRHRWSPAVWRNVAVAVAAALAANVLLALWQKTQSKERLRELGVLASDRLKEAPSGSLRVFGGFTSAAPLSYALAIALLAWIAYVLGTRREERGAALRLAWLPFVCVAGLALTLDRTAIVALALALAVVTVRYGAETRNWIALALVAVASIVGVAVASGPTRSFLGEALQVDSPAASARMSLWREYLHETTYVGAGPASAGSAYLHVKGDPPPALVRFPGGWAQVRYASSGASKRRMAALARIAIGRASQPRPRTHILAQVSSVGVRRELSVGLGRRVLARVEALPGVSSELDVTVPSGTGVALVVLRANPRPDRGSLAEGEGVAIQFRALQVTGLPRPADPALRVYEKRFRQEAGPGVVDNQYVAWIFEYGVLGVALCFAWLTACLLPLAGRALDALQRAAAFVGVFLVVAAVPVNLWEEAPTDLLAAFVFGFWLSSRRFGLVREPATSTADRASRSRLRPSGRAGSSAAEA